MEQEHFDPDPLDGLTADDPLRRVVTFLDGLTVDAGSETRERMLDAYDAIRGTARLLARRDKPSLTSPAPDRSEPPPGYELARLRAEVTDLAGDLQDTIARLNVASDERARAQHALREAEARARRAEQERDEAREDADAARDREQNAIRSAERHRAEAAAARQAGYEEGHRAGLGEAAERLEDMQRPPTTGVVTRAYQEMRRDLLDFCARLLRGASMNPSERDPLVLAALGRQPAPTPKGPEPEHHGCPHDCAVCEENIRAVLVPTEVAPKGGTPAPACDWCQGSRRVARYEDGARRGTEPCIKCAPEPPAAPNPSEIPNSSAAPLPEPDDEPCSDCGGQGGSMFGPPCGSCFGHGSIDAAKRAFAAPAAAAPQGAGLAAQRVLDGTMQAIAAAAAHGLPITVALCPECGPGMPWDEDGCCRSCGTDVFHDDNGERRPENFAVLMTMPDEPAAPSAPQGGPDPLGVSTRQFLLCEAARSYADAYEELAGTEEENELDDAWAALDAAARSWAASPPQGEPSLPEDEREPCGCLMGARWTCVDHCGGHAIPAPIPVRLEATREPGQVGHE